MEVTRTGLTQQENSKLQVLESKGIVVSNMVTFKTVYKAIRTCTTVDGDECDPSSPLTRWLGGKACFKGAERGGTSNSNRRGAGACAPPPCKPGEPKDL